MDTSEIDWLCWSPPAELIKLLKSFHENGARRPVIHGAGMLELYMGRLPTEEKPLMIAAHEAVCDLSPLMAAFTKTTPVQRTSSMAPVVYALFRGGLSLNGNEIHTEAALANQASTALDHAMLNPVLDTLDGRIKDNQHPIAMTLNWDGEMQPMMLAHLELIEEIKKGRFGIPPGPVVSKAYIRGAAPPAFNASGAFGS